MEFSLPFKDLLIRHWIILTKVVIPKTFPKAYHIHQVTLKQFVTDSRLIVVAIGY